VTINGKYHAIEIGTSTEAESYSLIHMEVYDADECYLVNEFAEIEVKAVPELPAPTLNAEKKLDGAGYYAGFIWYSGITIPMGVFYYAPSSLGQAYYFGEYRLYIDTDGSMTASFVSRSVNENGNIVSSWSDIAYASIYTAKLDS
jgi:hypothetical protein